MKSTSSVKFYAFALKNVFVVEKMKRKRDQNSTNLMRFIYFSSFPCVVLKNFS